MFGGLVFIFGECSCHVDLWVLVRQLISFPRGSVGSVCWSTSHPNTNAVLLARPFDYDSLSETQHVYVRNYLSWLNLSCLADAVPHPGNTMASSEEAVREYGIRGLPISRVGFEDSFKRRPSECSRGSFHSSSIWAANGMTFQSFGFYNGRGSRGRCPRLSQGFFGSDGSFGC